VPHNDVKPSNLLVQPNGHVIVTDFGIGQSDEKDLSDEDDRIVGTLRYMAPERWKGKPSALADVYAIGVSLYELSTQHVIFNEKKRSHLIDAILNREPARPRELIPEFPLPLEQIIVKAMAKDPEQRFPSAEALAEDLGRYINRQPVQAADQSLLRKTIDWWSGLVLSSKKRTK
jgi:serine/threonine protein kinase